MWCQVWRNPSSPVRLEGSSSEGMSAVAYMIRDYNSMYNVCVSSVMMMVMMMMCV